MARDILDTLDLATHRTTVKVEPVAVARDQEQSPSAGLDDFDNGVDLARLLEGDLFKESVTAYPAS
jgi:hypothetical protein